MIHCRGRKRPGRMVRPGLSATCVHTVFHARHPQGVTLQAAAISLCDGLIGRGSICVTDGMNSSTPTIGSIPITVFHALGAHGVLTICGFRASARAEARGSGRTARRG